MNPSNGILWNVLVCGEAATGKSQLLSSIGCENVGPNYRPVAGVDFGLKRYSAVRAAVLLNLQIWDLGRDIHSHGVSLSFYFSNSQLVLLVYDVNNRDSAEQLSAWYGHMPLNAPRKHVVVVGNKADLLPDGGASLMTDDALRQGALPHDAVVESTRAVQTADAFCTKEQLPHYVVSAEIGAGTDALLRSAVEASLRKQGYPCFSQQGGIRLPVK